MLDVATLLRTLAEITWSFWTSLLPIYETRWGLAWVLPGVSPCLQGTVVAMSFSVWLAVFWVGPHRSPPGLSVGPESQGRILLQKSTPTSVLNPSSTSSLSAGYQGKTWVGKSQGPCENPIIRSLWKLHEFQAPPNNQANTPTAGGAESALPTCLALEKASMWREISPESPTAHFLAWLSWLDPPGQCGISVWNR